MLSYLAWLILQLKIFRYFFIGEIEGVENLRKIENRGIVLVSNHESGTDPWRIGGILPFRFGGVYWLAATELLHFKSAYQLWLEDEDKGCIKACLYALASVFFVNFSLTLPVDRSSTNLRTILQAKRLLREKRMVGIFPEGGLDRKGNVHPIFVRLAMSTNSVILPVKVSKNKIIFDKIVDVSLLSKKEARKIADSIMANIYTL